jgi:hypothetical protein
MPGSLAPAAQRPRPGPVTRLQSCSTVRARSCQAQASAVRRAAAAGSARTRLMAAASAAGSRGPSAARSPRRAPGRRCRPPGWPPPAGRPPWPSINAELRSSYKLGSTSMSTCRSTAGTWTCGTNPVKCTRLPNRCAPAPTGPGRRRRPAAARPRAGARRLQQRADIFLRRQPPQVGDPRPGQAGKRIRRRRGEQGRVISGRDHVHAAGRDPVAAQQPRGRRVSAITAAAPGSSHRAAAPPAARSATPRGVAGRSAGSPGSPRPCAASTRHRCGAGSASGQRLMGTGSRHRSGRR